MKKCVNPDCDVFKYVHGGFFVNRQKYCFECGSKLAPKEEKKCQCGCRLGDNDKFCSGCGLPREEAVIDEDIEMANALLEADMQDKRVVWAAVENVLFPSFNPKSELADLKAIGPDLTPLTLFYALMIVPRLVAMSLRRSDKTAQSIELAPNGSIWLDNEESIPASTMFAQIQQAANITFETASKLLIDWIPRALMVQPRLFPGLFAEVTKDNRFSFRLKGIDRNPNALVRWWKFVE